MTHIPEPPDDEAAAPDESVETVATPAGPAVKGERIAKRLARAGVASRRDAERMIAEGRVTLDGKKLDSPATLVTDDSVIVVDGKPLAGPEKTRLWRYHKPDGLMTTHKDPQGRRTVFESLPEGMPRVISVGRLDYASEGLLLLTNDGELARRLELPTTGWSRRYRVRVHGVPDLAALLNLEHGVVVDGVSYGPIKALLDRQQGSNAWLSVSIKEGKNREVRKVMEHLGLPVMRLIRVAYGPFQLGNLEPGQVEEVLGKVWKEQLGLTKPATGGGGTAEAKSHKEPGRGRPPARSGGEGADGAKPESRFRSASRFSAEGRGPVKSAAGGGAKAEGGRGTARAAGDKGGPSTGPRRDGAGAARAGKPHANRRRP